MGFRKYVTSALVGAGTFMAVDNAVKTDDKPKPADDAIVQKDEGGLAHTAKVALGGAAAGVALYAGIKRRKTPGEIAQERERDYRQAAHEEYIRNREEQRSVQDQSRGG